MSKIARKVVALATLIIGLGIGGGMLIDGNPIGYVVLFGSLILIATVIRP